jgi:hypothetical protein
VDRILFRVQYSLPVYKAKGTRQCIVVDTCSRVKMSSADKVLPKKLEDDLNNAKMYKPSGANQESAAQMMSRVFDDSKERAMYDEILGPMLGNRGGSSSRLNVGGVLPLSSKLNSAPPATGTDFNSTILNRLKHVEVEAKESRKKIAELISENEALRQENSSLKDMVSGSADAVAQINDLKYNNAKLQLKLQEMEHFLGDYGLLWVGHNRDDDDVASDNDDQGTDGDAAHGKQIGSSAPLQHIVSFSEFNLHIGELNAVIYSEPAQVITEGSNQRKARLVQASELVEKVRIVYYQNGLMIKNGPFRACDSGNYKTFVKDIVDGYFPSEFQEEYPSGVVFDLKDQHWVPFVEGKTDSFMQQNRMSKAQLLNRLPKTVIHNGEVVGIREDIGSRLIGGGGLSGGGSGASGVAEAGAGVGSTVSAPKAKVVIDTFSLADSSSMGQDVRIQVKWVDQTTVVVAKMHEHNTVGDLKAYLERHFASAIDTNISYGISGYNSSSDGGAKEHGSAGNSDTEKDKRTDAGTSTISEMAQAGGGGGSSVLGFDFSLRSAYPPRELGLFLSLKEAGLVPNGTVHARKL